MIDSLKAVFYNSNNEWYNFIQLLNLTDKQPLQAPPYFLHAIYESDFAGVNQ